MFSFTLALALIISAVSLYGFYNRDFFERYLFDPSRIRHNREWIRIISSGFLHTGPAHLIFNMYSMYSFGESLERAYSPFVIAIVFFVSVLSGSLFSLLFKRKSVAYRAVGASGGVCGIIYSSIFLMEGGHVQIMFIPIPIPTRIYAVAFILISSLMMRRQLGNIGHDAHIGGALAGTLSAIAIIPWVFLAEWYIMLAMFAPIAILLLYERARERREG